jgi:hypothetical protein
VRSSPDGAQRNPGLPINRSRISLRYNQACEHGRRTQKGFLQAEGLIPDFASLHPGYEPMGRLLAEAKAMTFQERSTNWLGHAQRLREVALEIIGQCNNLETTKGTRDPKIIALAVLSRSLGHFKAIFRLLETGSIVEARTLTRCIFENLFVQGGLAEDGDNFVQKMVEDAAKSRQSRGTWVLGWLDEQDNLRTKSISARPLINCARFIPSRVE